ASDVLAADVLREAEHLPQAAALAASCIVTARFRAAEDLASAAAGDAPDLSRELVRIAQVGRALAGGGATERRAPSASGISTRLPTDEEAPLVALEALIAGEPEHAARAIDD